MYVKSKEETKGTESEVKVTSERVIMFLVTFSVQTKDTKVSCRGHTVCDRTRDPDVTGFIYPRDGSDSNINSFFVLLIYPVTMSKRRCIYIYL